MLQKTQNSDTNSLCDVLKVTCKSSTSSTDTTKIITSEVKNEEEAEKSKHGYVHLISIILRI